MIVLKCYYDIVSKWIDDSCIFKGVVPFFGGDGYVVLSPLIYKLFYSVRLRTPPFNKQGSSRLAFKSKRGF